MSTLKALKPALPGLLLTIIGDLVVNLSEYFITRSPNPGAFAVLVLFGDMAYYIGIGCLIICIPFVVTRIIKR